MTKSRKAKQAQKLDSKPIEQPRVFTEEIPRIRRATETRAYAPRIAVPDLEAAYHNPQIVFDNLPRRYRI